jgi:hypothetical protein
MVPIPPESSPARLTALRRDAGVLEHGQVVDVALESCREANHGLPPVVWWNHLDRIMGAVDDLGCLEFLA